MSARSIVAIVWAPKGYGQRSAAFSEWLGAKEYNIHYLKHRRPIYAPVKYIFQWLKTWQVLWKERPDFVFVTNSQPVAGLCAGLYCMVTRTRFALDTHPPTLFGRKWRWSQPIIRFVARRATINIIDQERFGRLIASWGAKVIILPDPPKTVPTALVQSENGADQVAFSYVGTFAGDEPIDILLDAARALPDVTFYLLGKKSQAKPGWIKSAPPNAIFTDYLVGDHYWKRLACSRAVIALTTHPHSLLAAAQDGLSIDKPLLLSDQPVLREYFTKGAVFVPHTTSGFVEGIKTLLAQEAQYQREIAELHTERAQTWDENFRQLQEIAGA